MGRPFVAGAAPDIDLDEKGQVMSAFALLINASDTTYKTQQRVQGSIEKIGLPFLTCSTIDAALEAIKEQDITGTRPALILLAPDLESQTAAARRLHQEAPLAHFAFLVEKPDPALVRQLKSPVSMIGTFWSIINPASENLTEQLHQVSNSARQRLQLRTTLTHINNQLASHSRAGISELQRYTISDRFLADILEHAQDAIITTNTEGVIITWNNAAERMFALSQDEAVGRSIADVAGGDWAEQLPSLIAQIRTLASAYSRQELVYHRADGRTLKIELMLSLVRDEPGEPIGMSAVVRDITERRNLEKRFQQAQKMESLGILAGGIAHDFNNILTSILINAELALIKMPSDSPGRDHIEKVQKSAILAAGLSNQMLAYSGRGHFVVQLLDLNEIINEMAHLFQETISKTAVINYQLAPELPAIKADVTQIRQVVMNLIINASEAIGDKSGFITITTGVADCDSDYLTQTLLDHNLEPGSYVYLQVSDTGCGMDKETQNKIFDPFYSTKFTGRGLGLAAVLGIIRGHKAAIEVHSEKGRGTTFKILFPASGKTPVGTAEETPQDEGFRRDDNILVIEDEESILEAIQEVLESAGFNILTASDGRAGLERFNQTKDELSLVILDLTMPHLNGEEVFKQMHQIRPEVPVVLTSGYSEHEIAARFAGKEPAAFLQKPFSPNFLLTKVREMLEQN